MDVTDLRFLDGPREQLDAPIEAARRWVAARLPPTRLVALPSGRPGLELYAKLENEQPVGAFKARGAWNQVSQLTAGERRAGVVTASSGNHAQALAWAAAEHGVPATVCMPANAYPSKIDAARRYGATVELLATRALAAARAEELARQGLTSVPPYDALGTLAGQGTLVREVLEVLPELDALVVPVGGGGLLAGCCLAAAAAAARRGRPLAVYGVEPAGAASMAQSLALGRPVTLARIDSSIQGLTPPGAGTLPFEIARRFAAGVATLSDAEILAAQARLVREQDWIVEPAGAAAVAWVFGGGLDSGLPMTVCCVISGGNPDPAQLAALQGGSG